VTSVTQRIRWIPIPSDRWSRLGEEKTSAAMLDDGAANAAQLAVTTATRPVRSNRLSMFPFLDYSLMNLVEQASPFSNVGDAIGRRPLDGHSQQLRVHPRIFEPRLITVSA